MLESLKDAITDPTSDAIEWVHTAAEVVEGVEVVIAVVTAGGAATTFSFVEALEAVGAGIAWPVTAGVAAVVGEFAMLGLPYSEAAENNAKRAAASGFAPGLIMGAMKESTDFVKTNFVKWSPDPNPFVGDNGAVAQHYYNAALVLGYRYGYELDTTQEGVLFRDLARAGGPVASGDTDNWSDRDWINFYIDAGARFRTLHITDAD